jgi:3'(2'), 5'-bisphosphate nucleotidase
MKKSDLDTGLPADFNPHDPTFTGILARLAIEAGACIMHHFETGTVAEQKADSSPVTAADREAEAIIEAGLKAHYPDVQIIGEEACEHGVPDSLSSVFFLLDPLDGTKEFVNRRKDFTVNIGLIIDNQPVAGVIYAPAHNTLYLSGADSAFMAEFEITDTFDASKLRPINTRPTPADGLTVIASKSHMSPETKAFVDTLQVSEMISAGSSLKFCLLAAGKADIYPRHGRTMEWDTAAGHAILNSAGGGVSNLDGTEFTYGKLERGLDNPYFIATA